MALFHCKFHSDTLGMACSMDVIIPQQTASQVGMTGAPAPAARRGKGHRTLLLLHGYSDDHTIWQRRTSIERYVAPAGLAVVMPNVHKSYYTDMAHGQAYWTFISEELPALSRQFFHLSDQREDNFVAGLSMGGYGALKLALRCPDQFAAAASLSGALDIAALTQRDKETENARRQNWHNVFGESGPSEDDDLIQLLKHRSIRADDLPRLYQCCGSDDFLLQDNHTFRQAAQQAGVDLSYEEDAGFGHTWDYWDMTIQRALRFMRVGPVGK